MLLCALLLDQSRKKLFDSIEPGSASSPKPLESDYQHCDAEPHEDDDFTEGSSLHRIQMQVPGRKLDHLYSKQLLKVKQCHQIKYLLRYDAESVGLMHSFVLHAFLLPIVQSIYFMLQRNGRLVNSTYNTSYELLNIFYLYCMDLGSLAIISIGLGFSSSLS